MFFQFVGAEQADNWTSKLSFQFVNNWITVNVHVSTLQKDYVPYDTSEQSVHVYSVYSDSVHWRTNCIPQGVPLRSLPYTADISWVWRPCKVEFWGVCSSSTLWRVSSFTGRKTPQKNSAIFITNKVISKWCHLAAVKWLHVLNA